MSLDKNPLVSVLMTAYNREKYIAEAIESVLASTHSDWELIIVDDGSVDKTVEIAKSYQSKDSRISVYVNEKNLGDYPNRNKAASYAKGEYIKYLDSDDIIYPHGLQVMVEAMEKFPEAGLGLSCAKESPSPYPILMTPREVYWEHFDGYGHFDRAPGSAIIKRQAFLDAGSFSGERMIGDYQLWLTLARYFPVVKFQPELYWSRSHDDQEQKSDFAMQHYFKLRTRVREEAFNHKDCPLSKDEIERIKKRIDQLQFRNRLKRLLIRFFKMDK